ncbi:MAG: glycine--tRNA ligase subunit beta [Pseudomonadales bacterium]
MSTQDFLVELGTEELPPKALTGLAAAFLKGIEDGLQAEHIAYQSTKVFAAPRRLAVQITALQERQDDIATELFGPPVKAAFDADGNATKAAEGFARKCGTTVDQLEHQDTDKGVKLAFRSVTPGKDTTVLLPAIVQQSLSKLPIPKRMRWGSSRIEFIRPVHWLVMLMGEQVVDCEILGKKSSQFSYGHRFHHNEAVAITAPSAYENTLHETGHVMADFSKRRELVRQQVKQIAIDNNGIAVIDPELLDEVTALVEWPQALLGGFDKDFLRLPEQALISSMKEHQKYFHVTDSNGTMLPSFITVSNIESTDPAQIVSGNERVIRPRLADAAFFYDTDRETALATRLELLKKVVFQSKLGTVYEKVERISKLAGKIATLIGSDAAQAERAGLLSKADLLTSMVKEFPDLQGTIGADYARNDGEEADVAQAIYEQYLPRFSGDVLPTTLTGCAVSIADKLDTICGLFAIGQPPTGDKDPFAIRRAALGILRIIVEKKLDLDLLDCIELALIEQKVDINEDVSNSIFEFILQRFRAWFQDENIPASVFLAVQARRPSRPLDFQQRVYAVNNFAAMENAEALAAANKRVSNILAKQGVSEDIAEVSTHLLEAGAEQELAEIVSHKTQLVAPLIAKSDYTATLENLADLRPAVDNFFDNVMVMTDDEAVRNNRLALLQQLRGLFLKVADISLLQS